MERRTLVTAARAANSSVAREALIWNVHELWIRKTLYMYILNGRASSCNEARLFFFLVILGVNCKAVESFVFPSKVRAARCKEQLVRLPIKDRPLSCRLSLYVQLRSIENCIHMIPFKTARTQKQFYINRPIGRLQCKSSRMLLWWLGIKKHFGSDLLVG